MAEIIPDDERKTALTPMIFAVNMLANTKDGDTFTIREYRAWLREAKFSDAHRIEAPSPSPLILARKSLTALLAASEDQFGQVSGGC